MRAPRDLVPIALAALLIGCTGATAPEVTPTPPSRQNLRCCGDEVELKTVGAYISYGEALVQGQVDADRAAALQEGLTELADLYRRTEIEEMRDLAPQLTGDLATARKAYREISDRMIPRLKGRNVGTLDLAIAYGRSSDGQWIQTGHDLYSPYGDSRGQVSWGTREQVKTWDEYANGGAVDGSNATPGGQPIQPPPPPPGG